MFNTDKPIKSSKDDLLGRSEFAHQLAEAIILLSQDSYVVGLYGEWGSGKTSVLNLTEEALLEASSGDKKPPIIIRFSPWGYTDSGQLISQFFALFSSRLKYDKKDKKQKRAGEIIEKYAFALEYTKYVPVAGPFLSALPSLAKNIGKRIKESASSREINIQYQKGKVIEALGEYKGKLVVFIDDIDRLPNDQIRMIFQLVNSVADFPNVTYVLSFDRDIVARALTEVQNCNGSEYLEKIVQVPFALPEISESRLQELLLSRLDSLFSDTFQELFDEGHWTDVFLNCVQPFTKSLRDIYRLMNVLEFKYSPLKNDINPVDITGITALEVFLPELFNWIKANKTLLTTSFDNYSDFIPESIEEKKREWLQTLSSLSSSSPEVLAKAISSLFPKFSCMITPAYDSTSASELRRSFRIAHFDRYDRYFTLLMGSTLLTLVNRSQSYKDMSKDDLVMYLNKMLKKELLQDYLVDTRDSIEEIPIARLPIFIESLYSIVAEIPEEKLRFIGESTKGVCKHLIVKMLNKISDENQRLTLFLSLLEHSAVENLLACADIIYIIERYQNRLGGNHTADYQVIFNSVSLEMIEVHYCNLLKEALKDYNILNSIDFGIASLLWKSLDEEGYHSHMEALFTEKINILLYVARIAKRAYSSNIGASFVFELGNDFNEFVTVETARNTLLAALSDRSFFSLSSELQVRLASFLLFTAKPMGIHDLVSVREAESWIAEQKVL
mgnify:CR=1 FL=1